MLKFTALFALAGMLAPGIPSKPAYVGGSWQIDTRHSDAQLVTDATTDFGKTKIDVTLGFARIRGRVNVNDADNTKSAVDLSLYPATAMLPPIDEDGKFLSAWLSNLSNHTLVCFHSKQVSRTPDGRVQATGNLVLTRVDRNVEATPSEGYAGPVYGPPMIHRVSREATLVLSFPSGDSGSQQDGAIGVSGSTKMFNEDFPELMRAIVGTYWPPVVQDKNCQPSTGSLEDYHGSQCTGTVLEAPALPEAPNAGNAEDTPGPSNFNSLVANRLSILVHLRLTPRSTPGTAVVGD